MLLNPFIFTKKSLFCEKNRGFVDSELVNTCYEQVRCWNNSNPIQDEPDVSFCLPNIKDLYDLI